MKVISLLFLIFSLTACIGTSDVDTSLGKAYFPKVKGLDLTGEKRVLPNDFTSSKVLLVVAYLQKQQADVDGWFPHIKQMMDEHGDLEYLELPTIAELAAPIRSVIYKGMRSGIKDEWMRKHVVTLHLDKKAFNEHLNVTDENQVYVYLLEKSGKIIGRWDGLYSDDKLAEIRAELKL